MQSLWKKGVVKEGQEYLKTYMFILIYGYICKNSLLSKVLPLISCWKQWIRYRYNFIIPIIQVNIHYSLMLEFQELQDNKETDKAIHGIAV